MLIVPSPEQHDRRARAMTWNPRPWIGPLRENVPRARRSAALVTAAVAALALADRYGLPDRLF